MLAEKAGNVVVIAGNNARKTDFILQSVQAGLNVLADKPMAITPDDLKKLDQAFKVAAANHVLLYDIMTERYEITTLLEYELAHQPALFGELLKGTPDDPAIIKESVHYFSKTVAGAPLKRPGWFFDVRQAGEGIVDITTHLVDMIQWQAFPNQPRSPADVKMLSARRWSTALTREQYAKVTGGDFPPFLQQDIKNGVLQDYCNGEMTYTLRGIHAKVVSIWDFESVSGSDTHFSLLRGSQATLTIKQGAPQKYKPTLYIERPPANPTSDTAFQATLNTAIQSLQPKYPGIGFRRDGTAWVITIPDKYDVGHEAHFGQVTENYLSYLRADRLPDWEVPNMLTKYSTNMQAYELSRR